PGFGRLARLHLAAAEIGGHSRSGFDPLHRLTRDREAGKTTPGNAAPSAWSCVPLFIHNSVAPVWFLPPQGEATESGRHQPDDVAEYYQASAEPGAKPRGASTRPRKHVPSTF